MENICVTARVRLGLWFPWLLAVKSSFLSISSSHVSYICFNDFPSSNCLYLKNFKSASRASSKQSPCRSAIFKRTLPGKLGSAGWSCIYLAILSRAPIPSCCETRRLLTSQVRWITPRTQPPMLEPFFSCNLPKFCRAYSGRNCSREISNRRVSIRFIRLWLFASE